MKLEKLPDYIRHCALEEHKRLGQPHDGSVVDNPLYLELHEAFIWAKSRLKRWDFVSEGHFPEFVKTNPDYFYKPGDLVIVTKGFDRCDTWMKRDEIIELGGKYWHSDASYNLHEGLEIKAKTSYCPEGNGNSWVRSNQSEIKVVRANSDQTAAFMVLGRGVTVSEAKEWAQKQKPKPCFEVGAKVRISNEYHVIFLRNKVLPIVRSDRWYGFVKDMGTEIGIHKDFLTEVDFYDPSEKDSKPETALSPESETEKVNYPLNFESDLKIIEPKIINL